MKKKEETSIGKKTVKINLTLRVIEIHLDEMKRRKYPHTHRTTTASIGSMRSFRYFRTQDQSHFDDDFILVQQYFGNIRKYVWL